MTFAFAALSLALAQAPPSPPNVVLVLADDLGYGDLGCYGQKQIRTPTLDALAAAGMQFTQAYAGSTVCAPSRCCLMTGQHTGHAWIRGNGRQSLRAADTTVATVLKRAGYRTACVGKWGLGDNDDDSVANKHGFDHFFGFNNHGHAHNYYPDFLWRNGEKQPIPANPQKSLHVAAARGVYAPDLFRDDALAFLDGCSTTQPFFLFYPSTIPHTNNERGKADGHGMEVPTDAPYSDKPWPPAQKCHAAMITRLDADVGVLLAKLRAKGLADNTLVIFTSDNGPTREGGCEPNFFTSAGPLRGMKRDLTEGGIRVPFIAAWLGKPTPAMIDRPVAFWDLMPTLAAMANQSPPAGIDGVSFAGTLTGRPEPAVERYLYWEFHEQGSKQAVRWNDWKAIRTVPGGPLELYDLKADLGETRNVAAAQPAVVAKIEEYLTTARTPSETWPLKPKK